MDTRIEIRPAEYQPLVYLHPHLYPIVFPAYKPDFDDIGHFYRIQNIDEKGKEMEKEDPLNIV